MKWNMGNMDLSRYRKVFTSLCLVAINATFQQGGALGHIAETVPTSQNHLQDVQIGEKGQFTRIALFCRKGCTVLQDTGGFKLAGIKQNMTINLNGHSENAETLTVEGRGSDSLIKLNSTKTLLRSSVNQCELAGVIASCIDLEFLPQAHSQIKSNNIQRSDNKHTETPIPAKKTPPIAISLSAPESIDTPPVLNLRNEENLKAGTIATPVSAVLRDVNLDTPASTENPTVRHVSATRTPAGSRNGSVLRPAETQLLLGRVDFREEAEMILRKSFDSDTCTSAKTRLAEDAWALDAMGTIGFCLGAAGNFEEAETVFRRLNIQEPDNHEALIGRALIAAIIGEKSIALKFFTDALEASPPDYISERISETIAVY